MYIIFSLVKHIQLNIDLKVIFKKIPIHCTKCLVCLVNVQTKLYNLLHTVLTHVPQFTSFAAKVIFFI